MFDQESLWELATVCVDGPLTMHTYKWEDLSDRYKNFLGTERNNQIVELTIRTGKYKIMLKKLQR